MRVRLALWLALVAYMIANAYVGRAEEGKPNDDTLYHYSTAVYSLIAYAIILLIVAAIATFRADLLGLRRPRSAAGAGAAVAIAIVAIYVFQSVYAVATHLGNEQGITPDDWEPSHATQYVVNGIVLATVVPFVEEVAYRGLGYSLLEPLGRWFAIVAVGVLFGLAHGLVLSFPVLALFGCMLAWVRSRTGSVYPGIVVHALFNALAVTLSVAL